MSLKANWSYPTAIRFGAGRIAEIGEACAAAGIKKPLLVTDRGLAVVAEVVQERLDERGVVGDDDHGPGATERDEGVGDDLRGDGVEVGRGLVEQHPGPV